MIEYVTSKGIDITSEFTHKESTYIAYSKNGDCRDWRIFENGKTSADIYRITEKGNEFLYSA